MSLTTGTTKDEFGFKKHGDIFLAAMKLATSLGVGVMRPDMLTGPSEKTLHRRFDSLSIELQITTQRDWLLRKQKVYIVCISDYDDLVFKAYSVWSKNGKKRHGTLVTFREGLRRHFWEERIMKQAMGEDYLMSNAIEVHRKVIQLLSKQIEMSEPYPSEMQWSPSEVVRRVFFPVGIEVRGFRLKTASPKVQLKAVKVVYKGEEVYEAVYEDPPATNLSIIPKLLPTKLVLGPWQMALQGLIVG
jgi:hypothetical protein